MQVRQPDGTGIRLVPVPGTTPRADSHLAWSGSLLDPPSCVVDMVARRLGARGALSVFESHSENPKHCDSMVSTAAGELGINSKLDLSMDRSPDPPRGSSTEHASRQKQGRRK